jgi:hypothetical protein
MNIVAPIALAASIIVSPSAQPPVDMPAGVRATLENRCIICHSDPSQDFGGLDLSHWAETPDGGIGFVHLDAFKKQRPSQHTFRVVLDRLTTTDADLHMPLGDTLKPDVLQELVDWISAQIHD